MARRSFRYYVKTPGGADKIRKPTASLLREFRAQALEMTTFNVGAGEAILLRLGEDAILVDGGAVVKKRNVALGRALRSHLADRGIRHYLLPILTWTTSTAWSPSSWTMRRKCWHPERSITIMARLWGVG
jgi:beta-lactamase superfamily II metal-dependent hydrolase